MNRRSFVARLTATLGVAGAAGWRWSEPPNPEKYGLVTIERHRALGHQGIHLHVFHQGEDITSRCFLADDTGEGWARVFLVDASGQKYTRFIGEGTVGIRWPDARGARTHPGGPFDREVAWAIVRGITLRRGAPFA